MSIHIFAVLKLPTYSKAHPQLANSSRIKHACNHKIFSHVSLKAIRQKTLLYLAILAAKMNTHTQSERREVRIKKEERYLLYLSLRESSPSSTTQTYLIPFNNVSY